MTTAQVGKILGMDARIVAKFYDRGSLAGFRIGVTKRRIHRDSVRNLAIRLGMNPEVLKLDFQLHEIPRNP